MQTEENMRIEFTESIAAHHRRVGQLYMLPHYRVAQMRRALLHRSPTMSISERAKQSNIPWWIAALSPAELRGWLEVDETGSPIAVFSPFDLMMRYGRGNAASE